MDKPEDKKFLQDFIQCLRGSRTLPSTSIIPVQEFFSATGDGTRPMSHSCSTIIDIPYGPNLDDSGKLQASKEDFLKVWKAGVQEAVVTFANG